MHIIPAFYPLCLRSRGPFPPEATPFIALSKRVQIYTPLFLFRVEEKLFRLWLFVFFLFHKKERVFKLAHGKFQVTEEEEEEEEEEISRRVVFVYGGWKRLW